MHNRSLPPPFLQVIGLEAPSQPPLPISCHGQTSPPRPCREDHAVMFLLHVLTCLGLLLVLIHLLSFLLTKLFAFLLQRSTTKQRYSQLINEEEDDETGLLTTTDGYYYHPDNEELATSIFSSWEEEGLFFFYSESVANDPLLVHEEKGYAYHQQHLFKIDENFVTDESPRSSSLHDVHDDCILGPEDRCVDVPATDVVKPSDLPELAKDAYIVGVDFNNNEEEKKVEQSEEKEKEKEKEKEEEEEVSKNEKLFSCADQTVHFDGKKFKLEERTFGASLTTSESTSKSSMEWRSSTIFRDSETDCPSSSSRRSSSNWETYTLFRKYDEEMMFFDRISAQKLTETDLFRSLKYQPRSISQRIVHKFTAQEKGASRDPYKELECAYVAQICLAWEALNWNYSNFRQKNAKAGSNSELSSCTTWMAQQFQQFQVLLQRFIENEPYERGRRPQVFARTRITSPKLLQVPELRDSSEVDEGKEEIISSAEFLLILEDAIRTFMVFLKADRENPFKALIKKKPSSVDPNLLRLLKRENKKMKMKLKELLRPRSCLRRKRLKGEQEMEVLMGLIDMKIVSRVLRMSEISQEQLHWCEEKMGKVRVWEGKIQRDSSPLFFPVH